MKRGRIHLATGPMFSGKTSWLIKELTKKDLNEVLTIKFFLDNRYDELSVVTHDGIKLSAKSAKNEHDIKKFLKEKPNTKFLGIDEIHFFKPSISDFLKKLRDENLNIYTVGLNTDYMDHEWETVIKISQIADSKIMFKAKCNICGKNNATKIHRKEASEERVVIGGAELYESLCEKDYKVATSL